jgi:ankyrin repeat protein
MHTPEWARKIHTITWYCEIDSCRESAARKEFADKGEFIQHFSTNHPRKLTKTQILAKTRRNRTTKTRDLLVCPLCDCCPRGLETSSENPQRQLAEHIAKDLRRLIFASYSYLDDEEVGSISMNTCVSGESGERNHRLSEVPSEEAEVATQEKTIEANPSPPELEEPVIWPTSLSRVYHSRDMTLELFAAALQRPHWEKAYKRYDGMMEQVNSQEPDMRALAIRSLLWVTFARRPMTGPELQHAVIVKAGDRSLDGRELPTVDEIIEACGGFLATNAEDGFLQLADPWMSRWLRANWPNWLRDTHEGITATVCLTYLLFDVFGTGFCTSDDGFENRLRSYPFYSYAAHNWIHHSRNDLRGNPLIWDFLQSEEKVSASYQALMAEKGFDGYSQAPPSRVTGLHLAVHFGLKPIVRDLLQHTFDPDVTDSRGRTPLSWAAEGDKPGIVVTLLEQGADVINSENRGGFAPISWAAWKGLRKVMEPLLQFGADTDARDSNLYTPLILATWNGHREIVELLVDKGAYIDAADVSGRTPLLLAAKNGYRQIAEHLLEHGANIESRDDNGNSSLSWAVKMGHRAVVELLVEYGADAQSEDDRGQTPLAWAIENGRQDIVTLLLDTEVKVDLGHGEQCDSRKRGKDRQSQSSADEDTTPSSDEESEEDEEDTKTKSRGKGKAPARESPLKKPQAPRSLDLSNWRRLRPRE